MFASGQIGVLHANADLLVGVLIGIAIGLVAGPLLRSWLMFLEWSETSRETRLTDALISRLDDDLDTGGEADEPDRQHHETWRTSR